MSGLELSLLYLLVVAFAGGVIGAAIGALQAFSLAGLVIIIGEVYAIAYRVAGEPAPIDITGTIGFGAVLGPHVAFGGGAAAVAYAAHRGYLDDEFQYHPGKHVTKALTGRTDVLLVGGLFGIAGFSMAEVATSVSIPTDPVALGVVLSALLHRGLFGYDIIGRPDVSGWLDMSPYERRERHPQSDRLLVEPWLPYQYRWGVVTVLGVSVGVLAAYLAYLTASAFLAFGISVVVLAFLCAGVANIPVTHHIALPASTIVIAIAGEGGTNTHHAVAGAVGPGEVILFGAIFGLLGAVFGELAQRMLYAHSDTHLDPPAASIVVTSLLIAVMAMIGIVPSAAWIPLP